MAASFLLHAAAFLAWRGTDVRPAGQRVAARVAAPTPGSAGALVGLRLAVSREEVPPPPRPQPILAEPEVSRLSPSHLEWLGAAQLLSRPGRPGGGSGSTEGGRSDGAGRSTPPVPRSLLPAWDPPAAVRGMEVLVRVHVDDLGRPTGEVELLPPTADREFNRRLVEKVRNMEYHPARREGAPVPGWAEITFVF